MGYPCLTLPDNTERPETIALETNELIGTDPTKIAPALKILYSNKWDTGKIPKKNGMEKQGKESQIF